MVLPWALRALKLLLWLTARAPVCDHPRAAPITDAILQQLSGKWFVIAGVLQNPEAHQMLKEVKATFFYLVPNLKEDTILVRDYETIGDQCIYNVSSRRIQRQEGTLSRTLQDREQFVSLWLTKDPETFMLLFLPDDDGQNRGLAFYARKPEVTKEQLREFHEALTCVGLQHEEILYTDGKKDLCGPLEKQQEEERKKENTES
ncbi:alpha-1-acid glycoprotein 1-like [Tamandua tetradactyla]|uniref:alpha-1-acid glycoprotein 1-like n=1 Tax=Tamandua tetradactyla TaxID=48850 RepID=UPI004054812A